MHRLTGLIRHLPVCLLLLMAASFARADLDAATAALEAGDLDRAEALLAPVLEQDDTGAALLLQGRLLLARNDSKAAYKVLDRAADRRPEDPDAHFWLGMAAGNRAANVSMFSAGRFAGVVRKSFGRALELDPEYGPAYEGLIGFHLQAPGIVGGSKKRAEELARSFAQFAPLEGQLALANVYRQTDRDDDALQALRDLTDSLPDEPRAWFQFGMLVQAQEDYATAHNAFVRATEAGDEDAPDDRTVRLSALYQVGRTAVFSNAEREAGIAALDGYIKAETSPDMPGKDWAHYRRGLLLKAEERLEAAQRDFATAGELTDDEDLLELLARQR